MANSVRIAVCQINIELTEDPYRIANLNVHKARVEKILRDVIKKGCNFVVFPEYSFDLALHDTYLGCADGITIIAGSYQNESNQNETRIYHKKQMFNYSKKSISPHEDHVTAKHRIVPGSGEYKIFYDDVERWGFTVMTCMDWYNDIHDFMIRECREKKINLIFAPCCNNNPHKFLIAAQGACDKIYGVYSVICNVAELKLANSGKTEKYGKSCVFGPIDKVTHEDLIATSTDHKHYANLMALLPEQEEILFLDIDVPYNNVPLSDLGFRKNPSKIEKVMP